MLPAIGCATFGSHLKPARDFQTAPESHANSWSPVNNFVELVPSAPGYYLASTKRDPAQAFGAYRKYLLVDIGAANPLVAWTNIPFKAGSYNTDAPYAPCRPHSDPPPGVVECPLTISLATPVAFNLLWDAFTNDSPIVNTDYTFGFDLTARLALFKDQEDRFRAYWGHISTHIGDEYFNSARRDAQHPFPRINPSYFPWRLGASHRLYTGVANKTFRNFVELGGQLEGSCLFACGKTGYYSVDTTQTAGQTIPLIANGLEYNVNADVRWYVGKPKKDNVGTERRPNSINAAVLFGRRRVFPYLPAAPGSDYDNMVNVVAGYSWAKGEPGFPAQIEVYGRLYRGPNPYGQLRNQRQFSFVSLGVRFR